MLREMGSDKIVGILKPDDTETYKLNDEHELRYRQYSSITTGYEHEMFTAICLYVEKKHSIFIRVLAI